MAAEEPVSFDEMLQADRKKRKNEVLANQLLGKGRRSSAPGAGVRKAYTGPSLASRMGVAKVPSLQSQELEIELILEKPSQRPSSAAAPKPSIDSKWGHDLHHVNNPRAAHTPPTSRINPDSRLQKKNRLYDGLFSDQPAASISSQVNVHDRTANGASEINIRGMGGPYTVIASNFAPGTTAADIEAVIAPIGGELVSCRLVSSNPTVIAEMTFVEKQGAENVIATFNNKKADGRLLYVYMKETLPQTSPAIRSLPSTSALRPDRDLMEIDEDGRGARDQYEKRPVRRAEPAYEDGRYGFGSGPYRDDRRDVRREREGHGLVSDHMMGRRDRSYRP